MASKCASGLKPCDRESCNCTGIDQYGWHVSLVTMDMPKTEDGARMMARDLFTDLGMEAGF